MTEIYSRLQELIGQEKLSGRFRPGRWYFELGQDELSQAAESEEDWGAFQVVNSKVLVFGVDVRACEMDNMCRMVRKPRKVRR